MRKIKYLFLSLFLLPLLAGCSFFDNLINGGEKIEINYIYSDKTVTKTYSDYTKVTFETCSTSLGYEFKGWSFEEDGSIISKNDLKGKTSVNLYPIITIINYTITYDLDGGTNDSNNPSFYTVEDELIINSPTKDEYAFIGWTTNTITEPVSVYTITKGTTGNITLTANYVHGKLSAIFNYPGIDAQTVNYGEKCIKPSDPYKLGDHFLCWCSDDSLENEFDFDTPITKSITLYPKFENTSFYTLTIENRDLIDSNYDSGKLLPAGASINLKTNYKVENNAFLGWYLNDEFVSNYYTYSLKMPSQNTKITAMFKEIDTYEYEIGSKQNLYLDVYMESDGTLYGNDIGDNYGHISNKLFISYYALDKLKPGLHSFVYENRIIIDVFIKVKELAVTNILIDYDLNYPYATLTFNEVDGYNYSYSLDSSEYAECHSGMVLDINKTSSHTIDIKCEEGTPENYVIEAIPAKYNTYLTKTFTYQGETFDHYIDSTYDLTMLLEYYICSYYPSNGGTQCEFKFIYPNCSDIPKECAKHIKGEISAPYGLHYSIMSSGSEVTVTLSSNGTFNSLQSSQEKHDMTTTQFLPSYRSSDFNDFYIEKCSKTQTVRSLYELESLKFGIKPIINDEIAQTVYNKAKEILREYVDDYMNDFEKIKAIYDYVASFVTYDDAVLPISNSSDYASFTSYGALINGVAVCDGISSAFKLLCIIEGIECIEVSGAASDGGHAWNKVILGGVWYGVDATWSKNNLGSNLCVWHKYFLINEVDLLNLGSRHFEQAEINSLGISGINIVNTSNNYLNYYDLMSYGKYDLVCSSLTEYNKMLTYFASNDIYYVEIYLENITTDDLPSSMYYSTYLGEDTSRVYLLKK